MSRRSSSATSRPAESRHRPGDRGITLIALVASAAIVMVGALVTVPTWRYVDQRDKEEELIFRGFEIVKGIRAWQKRHNTLPTSFELMVEGKALRKLYKDPFTERKKSAGAWKRVSPAQPLPVCQVAPPVPVPPPVGDVRGNGAARVAERPRFKPFPVYHAGMPEALFAAFSAAPVLAQGAPPGEMQGGFSGVISTEHRESYGVFNGKNMYDEWCFSIDTIPENVVNMVDFYRMLQTQTPERRPKFTGRGKEEPGSKPRKKEDDAGFLEPLTPPADAP